MSKFIRYDEDGCFVFVEPNGRWRLVEEAYAEERRDDYISGLTRPENAAVIQADSGALNVIVFLTEHCNLRCDYCKVHKMITAPVKKSTDAESITASLLESLDWTDGVINVAFYGGEPLLRYRELDEICTVLRARAGERFTFSVTTNGTICNNAVLDILRRHRVCVGVSIDGNNDQHDLHRKSIALRATHGTVGQNYLQMKRAGVECGPICVVTDPSRFIGTFDHLAQTYGDSFIYLKPLVVTGREDLDELEAYFGSLVENQLRLLERNVATYACGGVQLVETYTMAKLENIFLAHEPGIKTCKNSVDSRCSIGKTIRSIDPDGYTFPCPTLKKYSQWDEDMVAAIAGKNNYCVGCEYNNVCTSFCMGEMDEDYVRSFVTDANTAHVDVLCRYNKTFIDGVFKLFRKHPQALRNYVLY